MRGGPFPMPFWNGCETIHSAGVILSSELRTAHDKQRHPVMHVNIMFFGALKVTHQLIILAVRGLLCLTELIPPLMSTSFFTPLTCILLTLRLPLPNYQLLVIEPVDKGRSE
jgi:hypothetical protein